MKNYIILQERVITPEIYMFGRPIFGEIFHRIAFEALEMRLRRYFIHLKPGRRLVEKMPYDYLYPGELLFNGNRIILDVMIDELEAQKIIKEVKL